MSIDTVGTVPQSTLIVFTCPFCNQDLQHITLMSMPPKMAYRCPSCGWQSEPTDVFETIIRVPYTTNTGTKGVAE